MLDKLAARIRALRAAPPGAPAPAPARAAILDQYVRSAPSPQQALDIFKGEWWSCLPAEWSSLQAGQTPLFADDRIDWAIGALGGVQGRSVIELGPLEGGHTYMLERAGAESILAIEASTKAFLKCLVAKEILGMKRARFVLGDFEEYLRSSTERFDVALASGVVYHVRNPVELIHNIARVADRVFIWTQYFIRERVDAIPHMKGRFPPEEVTAEHAGFRHTLHPYYYGDFLNTSRFAGGSEEYSHWLSRDDLLGALRHAGLSEIVIGKDELDHANGPAITLVARRPA